MASSKGTASSIKTTEETTTTSTNTSIRQRTVPLSGNSNTTIIHINDKDTDVKDSSKYNKKQLKRSIFFLEKRTVYKSAFALFILYIFCQLIDIIYQSNGIVEESFSSSSSSRATSYSIIINTYKRPLSALQTTVEHYSNICGTSYNISSIYIIWGDADTEPPPISAFKTQEQVGIIIYQPQPKPDSLNHRFHVPNDMVLSTQEAFVTVDDDVRIDCHGLLQGFIAWKSHPYSIVGYYPRLHSMSNTHIKYHTWLSVYFQRKFSIILTKAAFVHVDYLRKYWDEMDETQKLIREYVDQQHNCEDIAMMLLIARQQRSTPPVYIEGTVWDAGLLNGISTKKKHFQTRTKCLTDLIHFYQKIDSHQDFQLTTWSLKDRCYTRHFFSFLIRPNNWFEWFPSADLFQ